MRSSIASRTLKAAGSSLPSKSTICKSPAIKLRQATSQRSLHTLPIHKHIKNEQIPGFLEAGAYRIAWTEHQQWLIDNLNRLVQGTPEETLPPKEAAIRYARDPNHAAAFNFASMAHNNDFFFKGIKENPSSISSALLRDIETQMSSLESLRETMLATADTMFGPGFVWLVAQREPGMRIGNIGQGSNMLGGGGVKNKLAILCTYLAGSPYSQAHWRKQDKESMTTDFGVRPNEAGPQLASRNPSFPSYGYVNQHQNGPYRGRDGGPPGAADVVPLLCVSTWEHAWLPQYGVGGKDAYLERWWDRIDWATVEHNYRSVEHGK